MSIELRLSNVEPPNPEPKRTIYRDIVNLPDPVELGMTIRYYNYDSVTLYFKVTGSGTGYTFDDVELGALAAGANAYINLDEFASRAKPSSETEENITITLEAYTDAAYTDLKWTFDRIVDVVFIDSSDPSYTVDELDNFDDGTVQGWDVTYEAGGAGGVFGVATDYVLSPSYSLKMKASVTGGGELRARIYKSFTTPNKSRVYAIINFRMSGDTSPAVVYIKYKAVDFDTTRLIFLGRPYDTATSNYFPKDKWARVVIPLPANTTIELRLIVDMYRVYHVIYTYGYWWMDDFMIISK